MKHAENEMGTKGAAVSHFKRPPERPFTAAERERVTLLFGGLTLAHEIIIKGVLEGLGYRAEYLPTPDNESLALGKEYGNRGQCNPTYYTVGNLIKYLKKLREQGVRDIEDRYVFVTAGACGPCRFGMYEAEYRKALRDAGFDRFRVIVINQSGEVGKELGEAGLKMDRRFYISLVKGIMAADLLNEIRYRMRPYEVNAGDTDEAFSGSLDILYETLKQRRSLFPAFRRVRRIFEKVDADYSRVQPRIKIIGEFWAQTTEGDGNYRLPRWLEEEGCEVIVQPVSGWVDYLIWWWKEYVKDRLPVQKGIRRKWRFLKGLTMLKLVDYLFRFHYTLYRSALGFFNDPLPSQKKLADLGRKYYNTRIGGGEGHLEVAKNLLAIVEKKAHLVISVKPFGCMPSTQSDGVQSRVMADFREGLFIPIETSGDGEINVKSRVQMKLHEAKNRAMEEFGLLLKETGLSAEELKNAAKRRSAGEGPLWKLPSGASTTAGNFALLLAGRRRG